MAPLFSWLNPPVLNKIDHKLILSPSSLFKSLTTNCFSSMKFETETNIFYLDIGGCIGMFMFSTLYLNPLSKCQHTKVKVSKNANKIFEMGHNQ